VRPCRRSVAACLTALLLAAPGAAWAQGAGDDQYEDPFGDTPPLCAGLALVGAGLRLRTVDPDLF
jgi:hypothetical protein